MTDCLTLTLLSIEEAVALLPVEPVPDVSQSNAGGWALLVFLVGLTAVELWLLSTGRPTISQWVQRRTRGLPWWKAFGAAVIGLALWHLLEGGPL